MSISRRTLLGAGAAGIASTALGNISFDRPPQKGGKKPKNIIFCVADGLSIQTLSMASYFRQITEGKPSYWQTLMNEEYAVNGLQETRSLNSVVTDSSAASSTWGCGRRIWNGQVNVYPDGTELRTLDSLMKEAGMRTGLVTTTTITHATPAGFAVNCDDRGAEPLIAEKYLKAGVDVLFGGGNNHFAADKRRDKKDLYADFAKAGYSIARTRDDLMALKGNKFLGIFSDSHRPYTVDHMNSPELMKSTPTLAETVKVALDKLKGSPKGFLLQIEGGKVDHAAHGNDFGAMVYDQIAFEEAVKVAVEFALQDKETLVIITADHATGGPSLNGAGPGYGDSTGGLKLLGGIKSSHEKVMSALGSTPTRSLVQDVIKEKLGIGLSSEEADIIVAARGGNSPFKPSIFHGSTNATLAMILGNHTKVTWTSGNHTCDHVMVTAVGPGSEQMAGITPNIRFFDIMLAAKGLKWSNPTMSYEDAVKARAKKGLVDKEGGRLVAMMDDGIDHGA